MAFLLSLRIENILIFLMYFARNIVTKNDDKFFSRKLN